MLLVNILGALLIALIIWWFWLYKPKGVAASAKSCRWGKIN